MFNRYKLLASIATHAVIAFDNTANFSQSCETVIIKGQDGNPLRVNKSDYDADQAEGGAGEMKLWAGDEPDLTTDKPDPNDPTVAKVPTPSTPNMEKGSNEPIIAANVPNAAPAPGTDPATGKPITEQLIVTKRGTGNKAKYHVTNTKGDDVTREGIDAAGYADEATAWQAIVAANGSPAPSA